MNETTTNQTRSDRIVSDFFQFTSQIATDPFNTLLKSPVFVIITILALILPSILKKMFPTFKKTRLNPLFTLLDLEYYTEKLESLETEQAVFEIGISNKSCSVSDNGVLRAIEFTEDLKKPSIEHIVTTIIKSIVEPIDLQELTPKRPAFIAYLETCKISDQEKQKLKVILDKYLIETTTITQLRIQKPELVKAPVGPFIPGVPQIASWNEQPKRGCFHCRKEIEGKASQCSACKAVIYCSVDCAKKNWATHKQACQDFKSTIDHVQEWNLHDFPFSFYTAKKPLCNYNAVPLLCSKNIHNVGLYQRLCGCYQEMPWGVLSAQTLSRYQQDDQISENNYQDEEMYQATPSPEQMFADTGLDKEMYPLSKPFEEGFDISSINSWKTFYEARGYSLDNPAALVLEVPLTIFHLINQFHLKGLSAIKEGEKRKITIHLLGVEKEADMLPIYECLLPLFPNTDLAIHMIGDKIAKDIPPQQRAMLIRSVQNNSSIFLSVSTSYYQPQHLDGSAFQIPEELPKDQLDKQNFGACKPDMIICLNAGLVVHQEWAQAIQAISKAEIKLLVTERMEQLCNAAKQNLPRLNVKVGVDVQANPFKQPLYDFKKDVNLPGWSNGFIFGIGEF